MMMEQVERKMKMFREFDKMNPYWLKTMSEGEWRKKGLSEKNKRLIEDAVDHTKLDPRSCHYTAQGVFNELDGKDNVQYCEGFAQSKWTGRTLRHAWIEINGKVAEITWPWHRFDGDDALYYGVSIENESVKNRLDSRKRGTIALLNNSEHQLLHEIKMNENI